MATLVNGFPTKEFFVEMLTRDIDLTDAILDLLDNCLDGVLRKKGVSTNSSNPDIDYSGYSANITITNDSFSIQDNCGGISKYIAINSAFRMGREANSSQDNNLPTVGIYGIGMKRAIFKIGREAKIISKCNDEQFVVTIPDEWTKNDSWNLELQDISSVPDGIADGGVIVTVTRLNQSIAALWADVGMGSYMFDDFKLIHNEVCISKMISLEKDLQTFKRATFNKPLKCISLLQMSTSEYIASLEPGQDHYIVWLDFTEPRQLGCQFNDFCRLISTNIIILLIHYSRNVLCHKESRTQF